MKNTKLIGKFAYIIDKDSIYYNEWGIIKAFDGDYYYVAIADGDDTLMIFDRDQLQVPRNQEEHKKQVRGTAI